MKIILAEHFGMCFGVRDALRQAETLAAAGPLTCSANWSTIRSPSNASRPRGGGRATCNGSPARRPPPASW